MREMRQCFCIGPQNGDPLCPCMMRAQNEEAATEYRGRPRRGVAIPAQSGWACPKCGNVYSPRTFECAKCNKGGGLRERIGP